MSNEQKPKLRTIKQEFALLLNIAYTQDQLKTIPALQLEEMEKVFFAGYKEAWQRINSIVGHMSEEDGEAAVKETQEEINQFFAKLAAEGMQQ